LDLPVYRKERVGGVMNMGDKYSLFDSDDVEDIEKAVLGKSTEQLDTDADGVRNLLDCRPTNPEKQDAKERFQPPQKGENREREPEIVAVGYRKVGNRYAVYKQFDDRSQTLVNKYSGENTAASNAKDLANKLNVTYVGYITPPG
ncbi:MAG: hypothetical protein ABEJ72_07925, partial [Candidatus Aenigmatarchaeota archaeon]